MKKNKTIILRIDEVTYNQILTVKRDSENLSETVRRIISHGLPRTEFANALANYLKEE